MSTGLRYHQLKTRASTRSSISAARVARHATGASDSTKTTCGRHDPANAKTLTSLHSNAARKPRSQKFHLAISTTRWTAPPPLSFSLPLPSSPPTPPPPMQSRPAAERPSRLSLLPLVRDLDEAAAGQPAEAPSGPKSQMEWDEEETPPRGQEKVRELFREVMYRHKRQKAAAAKAKASQEVDNSATSTTGLRPSDQTKEERKGGSIRNARNGIESRQKLEVSLPSPPHPTMLRSLTNNFLALEPAGLR
jgi:hypothetical protein